MNAIWELEWTRTDGDVGSPIVFVVKAFGVLIFARYSKYRSMLML